MSMTRVYIGRLSERATEDDLGNFFKGFGRIHEVTVKSGFGFVEFDDQRDADDAVNEMNGKELCGGKVIVELARRKPERRFPSYRGAGGGGGFGYNAGRRLPYGSDSRGGGYGYDDRRGYGGGYDQGGPPRSPPFRQMPPRQPRRTPYRLVVDNLSSTVSWRDLKDLMGKAGPVAFADVFPRKNEGIVEFGTESAMRTALDTLNDTDLNGRRIRLTEERDHGENADRNSDSECGRRNGKSSSEDRSRSRSPSSKGARRSRNDSDKSQ